MTSLSTLNDIPKSQNGITYALHSPQLIAFQIELLSHPELAELLAKATKEDNYEPEAFFGTIAAYCGIILEGDYTVEYLLEQLSRALVAKRSPIRLQEAVNTVPVPVAPAEDSEVDVKGIDY